MVTGEVSYSEFVDGCWKLQGEATLDAKCITESLGACAVFCGSSRRQPCSFHEERYAESFSHSVSVNELDPRKLSVCVVRQEAST